MKIVTATEAAKDFSGLLDAIEHEGESFVIERRGRSVASIGPAPVSSGGRLLAYLRENRPDEDFASDIESVRAFLLEDKDPWTD